MFLYKKIIKTLIKKNISIAVAESCTGGKISYLISTVPGVSKIFDLGLVTYSNNSKFKILKIPKSIINKHGAVSEEVSRLMIKNLYSITKSKICISTTGIAGPTGNTKYKPLGLIYIGIKHKSKIKIYKKIFKGNRSMFQKKASEFCLQEIKKLI